MDAASGRELKEARKQSQPSPRAQQHRSSRKRLNETGAWPFDRQGVGLGQRRGALLPGDCPACLPAEAVPSSDAAQLLLLERNLT